MAPRLALLLILALLPLVAHAQTLTLTGRVLDAQTGQPLPFASVYLNLPTRGTSADSAGVYRLSLPAGQHELVATYLGYATLKLPLRLSASQTLDLRLEPSGQALDAITVTARRSGVWQRQLRSFTAELLGKSPQARLCRITNPDVLRFKSERGHLLAGATEPLIIENRALGYRLTYSLLHFDLDGARMDFAGTARFEELPAEEPQRAAWAAARQRVYRGSLRHLLASLLSATHEREGYRVYRSPLALDTRGLAMPLIRKDERQYIGKGEVATLFGFGSLPGQRRLLGGEPLEVYDSRLHAANSPYRDSPHAYSLLLLPPQGVEITLDGWMISTNGLDVRGQMGGDRLATLLPADWQPLGYSAVVATDVTAGRGASRSEAGLDSLIARSEREADGRAPQLYVHLDKPLYSTGDRLWISAYALEAGRGLPVSGEGTLSVEIVAPSGKSVYHQWLKLTEGRATGDFRLSDTLMAGTYRLVAYTPAHQKAGEPGFVREFTLVNHRLPAPLRGPELATTAGTASPASSPGSPLDLQFLPEGGRWLVGVAGRLGIRAVGPDGRGRAISGRIVDDTGAEVARFQTSPLGLGQVRLTPAEGRRYRAELSGNNRSIDLPPAETQGWALAADVDSSRIRVRVEARGAVAQAPVYLTLQNRERVLYRQRWSLQGGRAEFTLPTLSLPPGVSRLTLWDTSGVARAERLVFVAERGAGLGLRVSTGKARYGSRESVSIGLQLRDGEGAPVGGIWSASVVDADAVPADTSGAGDLRIYRLLSGELSGRVEAPAYFLHQGLSALDELLLTHGWRRLPAAGQGTDGWSLSGRVLDANGQPLAGRQVALLLEGGGRKELRSETTDAAGRFRLLGLGQSDTVKVSGGLIGAKREAMRLAVDRPGGAFSLPAVADPDWSAVAQWREAAAERQAEWPGLYRDSTARLLAEVVIKAMRPRDQRPKEVERASLHGKPDAYIDIKEDDPRFMHMLRASDAFSFVGFNTKYVRGIGSFRNNEPLYLVDGVYTDPQTARDLEIRFVARIELLKNADAATIYGSRAANGVIAIYTRSGVTEALPPTSSPPVPVYGYVTPREYYTPRYELPQEKEHTDRRDVLYWQPLGQSGADGLGRLSFPLSDTARRLRIEVQGLTSEGVPMSFSWTLPVR